MPPSPSGLIAPPIDSELYTQIAHVEGVRTFPYKDGEGNVTIGIGWNLTANGLPDWIVTALYNQAVYEAECVLDDIAPWWISLDPCRQRAMISLAFNLSHKLEGFPRFLGFMQAKDFASAAAELQASEPWFSQVGIRGPMLVSMIATGEDPSLA